MPLFGGAFFWVFAKIVGWEGYESASADWAADVFRKAYRRESVAPDELVPHADNGSPMKGATMLATLQKLGVMASFSRPSVSDDNPYAESMSTPASMTSSIT